MYLLYYLCIICEWQANIRMKLIEYPVVSIHVVWVFAFIRSHVLKSVYYRVLDYCFKLF